MQRWDKIESVQKMQDYIKAHACDVDFDYKKLYSVVGYSKRHAERIFKELLGKTTQEYIKNIRMSDSSAKLLDDSKSILEVALDTKFGSHEGYTRAFFDEFGVTPSEYRKTKPPIPLFIQYPIKTYYSYLYFKGEEAVKNETALCMVSTVQKSKRKLMFLRSKKASDYWTYCEEMGCDWEGLFNSVQTKFDTAAILKLPKFLQKDGFSEIASGIEVPMEYDGKIPDGCEVAELEPCEMLYFQSEPFENEEDFGIAMGNVTNAIKKYNPTQYGYEYDFEIAPKFNFGTKRAFPVKRIK